MENEDDSYDSVQADTSTCHTGEKVANLCREAINLSGSHRTTLETVASVNLSIKQALQTSESAKWQAAIDKEYNKLVKANTWREPTQEELSGKLQILPVGTLLSKKRDGSHKCRVIALGNLFDKSGIDVYAPTLSMISHRCLLVKAARAGDFVKCFDTVSYSHLTLPTTPYV